MQRGPQCFWHFFFICLFVILVARLLGKCRAQAAAGDRDLSNSDNMALVGVLSTQLLHQQFVVSRPGGLDTFQLTVDIDREHRVEAALS